MRNHHRIYNAVRGGLLLALLALLAALEIHGAAPCLRLTIHRTERLDGSTYGEIGAYERIDGP